MTYMTAVRILPCNHLDITISLVNTTIALLYNLHVFAVLNPTIALRAGNPVRADPCDLSASQITFHTQQRTWHRRCIFAHLETFM
jgi:hypothetical protein